MQALSVRGLVKTYQNGAQALKGIDLEVEQGDFFALLGPNGAGKTTLIGILTSLVTKTGGEVKVFGLFRSWHNERALDPQGPWGRFTLAIAYATEAHLFITDLNQSPFNVGTRLALADFTLEQVAELNWRYGSPLRGEPELAGFVHLAGGHP